MPAFSINKPQRYANIGININTKTSANIRIDIISINTRAVALARCYPLFTVRPCPCYKSPTRSSGGSKQPWAHTHPSL